MTHDPMCYFNRESGEFDFMADRCPRCELIAKVRADEREQAARRIEAIPGTSLVPHIPLVLDLYADCAATARGES